MTRLLKYALVWLFALALPLQGFAAATMLCCGMGHKMGAENPSHQAKASMSVAFSGHTDHANGTTHTLSAPDHSRTSTKDLGDRHVAQNKMQDGSTCSVCAACCVSAAVLPAHHDEMPAPELPGLTVASFYPSQFTTHIPGTPQRPPLSFRL